MFLIIKGSLSEAIEAAKVRGIALIGESAGTYGSIYCHCDASHESIVREWFNEPGNAPFPAGSLLFFNSAGSMVQA